MRVLFLAATMLVLPAFVASAEDKKVGDEKAEEAKAEAVKAEAAKATAAAEKPKVRTVQLKSSIFQFNVRLEPGVPDPGQVEEVRIEMAEVPPIPDPIYGETIPVKQAVFMAEVTDADGAGYTLTYRVHPLTDAGVYGFHFTPSRKDTYQVVLRGVQKSQKFSPKFRVPVGIWPFRDVDAKGNEKVVPASPAGSRMPALPGSNRGPAVPTGPAGSMGGPSGAPSGSPLHEAMEKMGAHWVSLQEALFAGRRADYAKVKVAADGLKTATEAAAGLLPGDPDHADLIGQCVSAIDGLVQAAARAKAKPLTEAFDQVGGRHCNRCHFAKRWKILASPAEFPGDLP